jgi:glycerol-3-phosphate dehydrogenase
VTRRAHFDVAIIGAGVLGNAIAARLAQTTASVCVIEAAADVGEGASKGNAGVAMSYYAAPGTLEASLIDSSYRRWEEVSRRLDVPYRRVGALMVAVDDEERDQLVDVAREVEGCGVRGELISGKEAIAREPLVSDQCRAALWLPDEGVIDPMRLTVAYAELAVRNGATYHLASPVTGFESNEERLEAVSVPTETIGVDYVVNASGLGMGVVSALAGGEELRMYPRMGEYWILDRDFGKRLRHIVFAAPQPDTKGIHVIPTTSDTVLLGPSAEDGGYPDRPTHRSTLGHVFDRAQRLVPSISRDLVIKSYAGNRPASDEKVRVRMDRKVPNLVHVSNRSSGVGTSLGTADRVFELLTGAGLRATERDDAILQNPAVPRLIHASDPESLRVADPRYGQVICVCEQVTAAEIAAALSSPMPARSISGVWKRTHATGGRCQGSVCMAGVAFMCSLARDVPPGGVRMTDNGAIGV